MKIIPNSWKFKSPDRNLTFTFLDIFMFYCLLDIIFCGIINIFIIDSIFIDIFIPLIPVFLIA